MCDGREVKPLVMNLAGRSIASKAVPCNGCTACCRRELVPILPAYDQPEAYATQTIGGALFLAHRDNGDCVYLGANGCTIHARAPAVCRAFDCRRWFLSMTRVERRQLSVPRASAMRSLRPGGRGLRP